jgi:hypothetical protein
MTQNDYEKLFMYSFATGEVVRVLVHSKQEFNSERQRVFRVMQKLKKLGKDLHYVSLSKVRENDNLYLQISNQPPGDTKFYFKRGDSFVEEQIEKDDNLKTTEELEFHSWKNNDDV